MRARRLIISAVVATVCITIGVFLNRTPRPLGQVSAWPAGFQHALVRMNVAVRTWSHAVTTVIRIPGAMVAREDELHGARARIATLEVACAASHAIAALERARVRGATMGDPIAARILSATFTSEAHALTLDRGTKDGVTIGDPITANGTLLGAIEAVGARRALARLLSAPGSRVSARRTTAAGVVGVVEPHVGGGIVLAKIPNDDDIHTGDALVTDATNIGIPAGIPIGTLTEIHADADGFFRTAVIVPGADPRGVLAVDILRQRTLDAAR